MCACARWYVFAFAGVWVCASNKCVCARASAGIFVCVCCTDCVCMSRGVGVRTCSEVCACVRAIKSVCVHVQVCVCVSDA